MSVCKRSLCSSRPLLLPKGKQWLSTEPWCTSTSLVVSAKRVFITHQFVVRLQYQQPFCIYSISITGLVKSIKLSICLGHKMDLQKGQKRGRRKC